MEWRETCTAAAAAAAALSQPQPQQLESERCMRADSHPAYMRTYDVSTMYLRTRHSCDALRDTSERERKTRRAGLGRATHGTSGRGGGWKGGDAAQRRGWPRPPR